MEIRIDVMGHLPPAKGEAKSMLSEAHPQHRRVLELLRAASDAMRDCSVMAGDICIDVILTAPRTHRLPDATMLGGIADVLQARATGADVQYLGPVASAACFHDDAQIQELHYRRVEEGHEVGYLVVVRPVTP